ncbi:MULTISPECIES: nickel-dependent hydrogenase large subunit [unclassified Lebetimonas]|uniref:nickel-dependent hydrogenase large subunit n=1 Tax=unclassified Lebetimonas TaxID=2648158 RepID=UPI00046421C7|nr:MULTISPECIES: nickel-dependent hydrogenase large subunit [unclassified Lebetimonas]
MKITKKIVNKIEGEASLKIYGEEKVDFVEIEFWQYRSVESYLINRPVMDALVINPRICGICGHSHLFATVKAIENAVNAKVSKKAEILRDITVGLEIVENHIKWFYITLFPTQIKDKKYIFKAGEFAALISKAIALIAGQYPHNSYMVPGGVTSDPTNLEIIKLKDLLNKIYEKYQEKIMDLNLNSEDIELFFENLPKDIGKSINRFLVLGDNLFFKKNGDVNLVKEVENSSLSKNVLYNGEFVEVGPLARNINNENIRKIYNNYKNSIFTRILTRVYEGLLILEYLINKIKEIDICEPSYIKCGMSNSKGIAAVEAPRGSLIHEIEIKNGKIAYYNIIVPTQFNLSSSKDKNKLSAAQSAMINEKKEYIDSIFKCFDICAVCVSH